MRRSWYAAPIDQFLHSDNETVLAELVKNNSFSLLQSQRDSWLVQLQLLRDALATLQGRVFLEFEIPRMGKRIDAVVLSQGRLLVIEFKVGQNKYLRCDLDQTYDYALDLKYFHEASHRLSVIPVLVATHAADTEIELGEHHTEPGLYKPVCANATNLEATLKLAICQSRPTPFDAAKWEGSRYTPTPTIIEAARALYAGHEVSEIARCDASAINLQGTTERIIQIIETTRTRHQKAICFVTGVPGAGKTLVGLNIATKYNDPDSELHSVFLSGNGPLVAILREALARDLVRREALNGRRIRKKEAQSRVQSFVQNVHHFRDECLRDRLRPPVDHVALFDEAQRAWDKKQTSAFMRRKKGIRNFDESEPDFLISCMDRRADWAVVVCLVGGGQEINTGEAGIGEWLDALERRFPHWNVHISPNLVDSEYSATDKLRTVEKLGKVQYEPELHLGVSMRSFRAEHVSSLVKEILNCKKQAAVNLTRAIQNKYPIAITRELDVAKEWLRNKASGSERYGIVVSSQAERLKPLAIDVRSPLNPVKWFLDDRSDVKSSYYLEDAATEFHVQGLELDWTCVTWDGDFRFSAHGWQHYSFRGSKWQNIRSQERQTYLKNAYRVLLTRARQGMIIVVPKGDPSDPTRCPSHYNATYEYLKSIGLQVI
ncbi:MAG: hypothetical protein AMXMBFR84_10560 [Candidatus Hydrogenedentota bacterium]